VPGVALGTGVARVAHQGDAVKGGAKMNPQITQMDADWKKRRKRIVESLSDLRREKWRIR